MADPATPPPLPGGLPCPQCGFLNAVNSVYCQDCGAKLPIAPPSYLSPPAVPPPKALPTAVAGTVRKKPRILSTNRPGSSAGALLGVTLRTIVYAAVLAGVIQLFRAPRNLPPAVPGLPPTVVEQVRAKFTESAMQGIPVNAPWDRTNAYLAGVLMPAEGGASAFVRATVSYRPGGFAFLTEKRIGGFLSVFTTIEYSVVSRGNGLSLVPAGGAIGRLPIPAWAAGLLPIIGGNVAPALQFELGLLNDAQTIKFSPEAAHIGFAPAHP